MRVETKHTRVPTSAWLVGDVTPWRATRTVLKRKDTFLFQDQKYLPRMQLAACRCFVGRLDWADFITVYDTSRNNVYYRYLQSRKQASVV